jgi:hypothetical protein
MVELHQEPSDEDPHFKYRREAKGWAIAGAVIYSLLALFFTYWYVVFSHILLDATSSNIRIARIFLTHYSLLLPVPLPVYLMFKNYLKKENKSTLPSLSILILYYGAITTLGVLIFFRVI